ncbi:hypothetical protein LOK49_Contig68G00011 [Camellia lanceoleosa]|nr:hypothetical protein LOK49_Contig68G00011 [Camellia lanceoleosa]
MPTRSMMFLFTPLLLLLLLYLVFASTSATPAPVPTPRKHCHHHFHPHLCLALVAKQHHHLRLAQSFQRRGPARPLTDMTPFFHHHLGIALASQRRGPARPLANMISLLYHHLGVTRRGLTRPPVDLATLLHHLLHLTLLAKLSGSTSPPHKLDSPSPPPPPLPPSLTRSENKKKEKQLAVEKEHQKKKKKKLEQAADGEQQEWKKKKKKRNLVADGKPAANGQDKNKKKENLNPNPNSVKPHAEKWKCIPIGNYEKLAEIYGKDRATGVGAETAKEKVRRWANSSNNDHVDRIEVIDELVHQNEANLESFVVDQDDVVLSPKSGTSSKAKKRKLSNDGERDADILKIALQDIALAIREGNASMEKSQGCFPRGELHKALEEIGIAPLIY